MNNAQMIQSLNAALEDLRYALLMLDGVVVCQPCVVQMGASVYLVAKGEGYGAGSILRAVGYDPELIEDAVQYVRDHAGHLFPNAKAILRRDALKEEIAAIEDIVKRLEALEA
jgi:hypothetical protein